MGSRNNSMALVEKDELERIRQRQIKEYNPLLSHLVKTQDEIEKLFDDPKLTDEAKCKILAHLQVRFADQLIKYNRSNDTVAPIRPRMPSQAPVKEVIIQHYKEASNADDEEDILTDEDQPEIPSLSEANIPTQFAKKFGLFQNFLKNHQNVISTNEKKEIVLDGEAVFYSSFPDLLRSLYVRNQDMNLIGAQQFHKKLHQLNARPDMFSNRETLNALSHLEKKAQKLTQTGSGPGSHGKRPRFLRVFP